ncbi:MAG: hypothetical protein ACPGVU_14585 [Limisphaerales bacterium]
MVWFFILSPFGWTELSAIEFKVIPEQMWAMGATLAMFAYTMMGIWMDRIYLWMGLSVTAAVLVGQFVFTEWFWLWCGISNGGVLILGAIILLRRHSK